MWLSLVLVIILLFIMGLIGNKLAKVSEGRNSYKELFNKKCEFSIALIEFHNIFLTQEIVDQTLSRLASELNEFCQKEINLQQKGTFILNDDKRDFLERSLGNLERIKAEIEKRKESFWKAHALAHRSGYRVRKSYKDYLPKTSTGGRVGVGIEN